MIRHTGALTAAGLAALALGPDVMLSTAGARRMRAGVVGRSALENTSNNKGLAGRLAKRRRKNAIAKVSRRRNRAA